MSILLVCTCTISNFPKVWSATCISCVFISQIESNEKDWRVWYEKEKPEEEDIPCGYQKSLDVFRKLLLIRSWSPDRTVSQARKYIMGEFLEIILY